jgi:hypothetical protein
MLGVRPAARLPQLPQLLGDGQQQPGRQERQHPEQHLH